MGQFESFIGVNPWTALFVLFNTLAVFFVAKHFLFGPVMNIIRKRQEEIDGLYADANKAKDEADQAREEYQKKLSEAQMTSERLVQEAVTRGQNREEEILRRASEQADAILEKANRDIAQEKKKALNDAKDEISAMAMAIAGKVVGRELSGQDQTQLVDAFISQLGEEAGDQA